MDTTTVLPLLLGIILGALLTAVYFLTRGRRLWLHEGDSTSPQNQLAMATTQRTERMLESQLQNSSALGQELQNLGKTVAQIQATVTELDKQTTAGMGSIQQRFNDEGRQLEYLRNATTNLTAALNSRGSRGFWGEVELRRLVEAAGMTAHVDFREQATLSSGARPDLIIMLPRGAYIPVDSKVPLDAYLRLAEAQRLGNSTVQHEKDHAAAVRNHVKALVNRAYHNNRDALGFTLLFLPYEPLLSVALEHDPTLLENAISKGVYIVTPTSLLSTLRTAAQVWTLSTTETQAREIIDFGQELIARLQKVLEHYSEVGRHLGQAINAYNQTVGSIEKRLLSSARKVETYSAKLKNLEPVEESSPRRFNSPELSALNNLESGRTIPPEATTH